MAPIEHIYPNTEIERYSKQGKRQSVEGKRPDLGSDGLFISDEARRLQQRKLAIELARTEIDHSQAVRKELVTNIKEKLTNGNYIQLSEEMAGVIAERIIDGLFLK